MKKSTEQINIFVESARDTQKLHTTLAQQYCLEILQEKGATSKATAILFEEDDRPVTNFESAPATEDVASADVVRVWCDGDFIYADLYFYYLQEWSNNVLITNDREFDWIILLDYLNSL
jgi:hypothetical protein